MKKALLLLGGIWHDFEGFYQSLNEILQPRGWEIEATYQMDRLSRLQQEPVDLVISYTCLGKHREGYDDHGPESLSLEQISAWRRWVQAGGSVLAVHSATVLGDSDESLAALLGGSFIEHPPQFNFTVYPLSRMHAIIEGVEAFNIRDEFYIQNVNPQVDVHMVAIDRGKAYPMVWSKTEGKGKIAYLAPGHNLDVWRHPAFGKLVEQSVHWLKA